MTKLSALFFGCHPFDFIFEKCLVSVDIILRYPIKGTYSDVCGGCKNSTNWGKNIIWDLPFFFFFLNLT